MVKKEKRFVSREQQRLVSCAKAFERGIRGEPVHISFPLLRDDLAALPTKFDVSGARGFVEVRYENILPKGFEFSWRSDGIAKRNRRASALVQSLFGKKIIDDSHYETQIKCTGQGEIVFRRPYDTKTQIEPRTTVPRVQLSATKEVLDMSAPLIEDFRKREDQSVQRALMTLARSGHPGALEILIEEFAEAKETKDVISILRENKSNPKLKESFVVIAILVDKDIDAMVEAATSDSLSDDYRKRACKALIHHQDQGGIVRALENPPFGLEVELISALDASSEPQAAQEALMRMLDTNDHSIMMAAARAFQGMGTRDAVMPLQEFLKKWGLDRELKNALEVAIESIQSRIGDGNVRGGLSVVAPDDKAGELSLSSEQKGRVALAKQKGAIKSS
jgi:hypothetical protein